MFKESSYTIRCKVISHGHLKHYMKRIPSQIQPCIWYYVYIITIWSTFTSCQHLKYHANTLNNYNTWYYKTVCNNLLAVKTTINRYMQNNLSFYESIHKCVFYVYAQTHICSREENLIFSNTEEIICIKWK